MGLWNLAPPPSCLALDPGEPEPAGFCCDKLNTSIVSTGDGGLSSSVADLRRTLPPVTESSMYMFKKACKKQNALLFVLVLALHT